MWKQGTPPEPCSLKRQGESFFFYIPISVHSLNQNVENKKVNKSANYIENGMTNTFFLNFPAFCYN